MAKKRPAQVVTPGDKPKAQTDNTVQNRPEAANSITAQTVLAEQSETTEAAVQVIARPEQAAARPVVRIAFPEWPTSRRGPQSTPPPPGTHSMNPLRPEQLAEIGYNQETGEPSA